MTVTGADPHPLYSTKDIARGYLIDLKRVILAYAAETVIILTSLVGAGLFADQYGHHSHEQMTMMVLAPVAYAVVEFCRVPLAIAVRRPAPLLVKFFIVLGLLGAGCVTIKSMSQLGEIMFRPRLFDVVHAREQLADAQSGVDTVARQIGDADALIGQRREELTTTEDQLKLSTDKLGSLPKQDCSPTSGINRNGNPWRNMKCVADPRIGPLMQAIDTATVNRKVATDALNEADIQRKQFDRVESEAQLRVAKLNYREAVMNSQLHSFSAMVFGKEPTEVTDAEIHLFLRFFVFIPAIGAAFSATIIALTAVTKIKIEPDYIELADGGEYILGPLAEQIIRDATAEAVHSAQNAVHTATQTAAAQAGSLPRPLAVVK